MNGIGWPPAPLDLVFPRPRLVVLGGKPFKAGELTLGDRATLQAWLRDAAGDPLASLPPFRLDPDPSTRRARLLSAWAACKLWPPALGTGQDAALMSSDEGKAVFLLICLADRNGGFSAAEARVLAQAMTPAEWTSLRRIAWGIAPWREVAAELDVCWLEESLSRSDDATDWGRLIAAVMKKGNYTYADLEPWTATQLRLYLSDGELDEYRAATRAGETKEEFERRMIATFSRPAGDCDAPP